MTTAYTSLLGLALPVTGELSGTWGDTVNNAITSLLDTAVAGTTTLSTDADVTLTTTTGASNQARQAIILWTASGTVTRNITAPAQSKIYTVINKTGSTQSIVIRGAGPTTGVTIPAGASATVAWNGSDFVDISAIAANNLVVKGNLTVNGTASFANYTAIGTTASSSYALDIQTDVGPQIRSLRPNNTLDAENYHTQYARGTGAGNLMTWTTTSDGSNGVKQLRLYNSSTTSYPVTYSKDGYVGVNNTSPATWFHIVGTNNAARGQMTIQSSASNVNPRLTFWYGGGSPSYNLDIYGDTAASNAVYDSGIGYGHKWSVNGSTKMQLNTNALLALNGATAQSWNIFTSGGIIQLDEGNYITGLQANSTQIGSNGYFYNNWVYQANGPAANINVDSSGSAGAIYLRTAPTGTAGANLSNAWVYNLSAFSSANNSFNNSGVNAYTLYIEGQHTSGYGGVYFNSSNTAYYCTRSATTDGQGLRMLNSSNAEIARLSIEPTSSEFQFYVSSDVPINFYTNGAKRWSIDNSATSGNLIASATNAGIKFNKSGALNNQVLNDYEYGTWTPQIGASGGANFTMTEQNGIYVKVGQMVTVIGILSYSSKGSASSSAACIIKNLPFTSNSDATNTRMIGNFGISPATATNFYSLWLYGGGNDTNMQISGKNSLTANSYDLLVSDMASSTNMRFSITYVAN